MLRCPWCRDVQPGLAHLRAVPKTAAPQTRPQAKRHFGFGPGMPPAVIVRKHESQIRHACYHFHSIPAPTLPPSAAGSAQAFTVMSAAWDPSGSIR